MAEKPDLVPQKGFFCVLAGLIAYVVPQSYGTFPDTLQGTVLAVPYPSFTGNTRHLWTTLAHGR
jgi:hypothetical protein